MGQDPTITLSIKETGESPNSTYLFHVLLDGNAIISNQCLSSQDSRSVREVSSRFGALFEQGCGPETDADAQRVLGKQLFDFWLGLSWEKIKAGVPVGALRFLVIASEVPEILNLPGSSCYLPMVSFSASIHSSKFAAFPAPPSSWRPS